MLFPTIEFGIFFFIVFFLSWMLIRFPEKRKWFLVLASYIFFGFWDWRFTALLFSCSFFNYIMALGISNAKYRKVKKRWLAGAVIINLGILFFFKYYGFFMNSVTNTALFFGIDPSLRILPVILPVGISFFTFQAMSYVIDVYRGEIHARESAGDVLLYVSFFPQLVAGPIVRASVFLPQLDTNPAEDQIPAGTAFVRIASGLFKKTVIANYLAVLLVDPVFLDPSVYSPLELLLGVYGYAFQIFCDFSAYSDIAIGIAALLGYKFPENFNQPYRASSFQDFWRRWHISLSSWLRDYLYLPLGGSRGSKRKTYRNLMITMVLGGLWHGAAWNFVIWGTLHGGAQALERALGTATKINGFFGRLLKRVAVFNFVCLCWIFFRAPNLRTAIEFLKGFAGGQEAAGILSPFVILLLLWSLLMQYFPPGLKTGVGKINARLPVLVQGILFGAFLLGLHMLSPKGVAPFIYFQF